MEWPGHSTNDMPPWQSASVQSSGNSAREETISAAVEPVAGSSWIVTRLQGAAPIFLTVTT